MAVSQKDIADLVGLDRTTVTRILNRDPKYSASPETRERVFRAAEILGYDFSIIRRPFKREYGRTDVDAPCGLTVKLGGDRLFDEGTAVVRNISVGGALLVGIRLPKGVLPLERFTILLRLDEVPDLQGLVGECEVVRLAGAAESGGPELGVRFINASYQDRRRIQEFVERRRLESRASSAAEAENATPSSSPV